MIDWTEIPDGDSWELFARDFLASLGLTIMVPPGRGADGGRDLIVSEPISGVLSKQGFRWLVSCKHFAAGGGSVRPADEPSITDRLAQHKADGFMGFYSTVPSNALVERLKEIERSTGKSYFIWDSRSIESSLLNRNQTNLFIRYLPSSFAQIRPIAKMLGEVLELPCSVCGKDALKGSLDGGFNANLLFAMDEENVTREVHVACKGTCDPVLEERLYRAHGYTTAWEDITDLCNPLIYLRRLFAILNNVRENPEAFSDGAFEKVKQVFTALSQRTLRPPLPSDEQRYRDLLPLEGL